MMGLLLKQFSGCKDWIILNRRIMLLFVLFTLLDLTVEHHKRDTGF